MPNSYFQFKQFVIHQDRCAMKVCTDACILGAWLARKMEPGSRVLDIGSGTGLLMLMLAQNHEGVIRGIELDPGSWSQSGENIAQSRWKGSLEVYEGDVRDYVFPDRYDLIISNPPFFEGDLPSASGPEKLAKHSKELRLAELIGVIGVNLENTGSFGILLPWHRTGYFEGLAAAHGFRLREKLRIRQGPGHDFFRSILLFAKGGDLSEAGTLPGEKNDPGNEMLAGYEGFLPVETELTIKNAAGNYTEEFTELMKDYYLYL